MATRSEVYEALDSEREYQQALWGKTLSSDRAPTEDQPGGFRTLDEYVLYISGYTGDLVHDASHYVGAKEQLDIIRKIGALCVAAMEAHGAPRREFDPENLRQVRVR